MNTRAIAARALQRVSYQGESLTEVLQHSNIQNLSARDQAWVRHVCFGAVRWHGRLGAILRELLDKSIKASDKDIECLLRLGLYQIIYQRTPDHAAVSETVQATKALKKAWAGSLVNGVLRRFLREQEIILAKADQLESAQYSFPTWLADRLKQAWPEDWQTIMRASNEHPPLSLRVNALVMRRAQYLERLQQSEIAAKPWLQTEMGIYLPEAFTVTELPDFARGAFSVQDAAAQQAAPLLTCHANMRVLDACAAPGGKTCHLLERYPGIDLWALDNSSKRTQQVYENLTRLNLKAQVKVADADDLDTWWDGRGFDRILLDAPCSATGVIRRHPDIKLLRKKTDIATLQQQQAKLLKALWQVLKPGGQMLYATCSILPEENNLQIEQFLQTESDVQVKQIEANWGRALSVGRQILPGEQGMDGFYYALLEKTA
ncbi:16S rRNA (cytosine(967)-C(5))-methyltransferase RsmB [uncultured Thiothrix sp.]|uniref:16S rRNA (cytosine(967)-C(5))-methyltransferase RsmB n=1 Tax=uncultured Thiothrix sp. TaxID=223185 RepID=UPI0026294841|nr:16S rRNA (cytosine(967)-C(5))-methyltransferase RsmB [uncultured Thiothrix sp.]HMT93703.1 16S rRNA (cytosine(967)-C(5))-methyltransferase RsmB [Thiolinea sp.]